MKLSERTPRKFIETYPGNGRTVTTPTGTKEILEVHKTVPLELCKIILENGCSLECAFNHVLMGDTEIYAIDSLGKEIKTIHGDSKVIDVIDLNKREYMYDISIDSEEEVYYSNGILSHNSGKSVTTAIYLTWKFIFDENMNIGIVANKASMAREFLNVSKNILLELPVWMQPGMSVWNKGSIESESKMRILTDSPSSDSFRGFSINCLEENSKIKVYDKKDNCYKEITMGELYSTCSRII